MTLPIGEVVYRGRPFVSWALAALLGSGCVPTVAPALTAVTTPDGRTTGLAGLTFRTDVRFPRTYRYAFGLETTLATHARVWNGPVDVRSAGLREPAERLAVIFGPTRVPEPTERWGYRLGVRVGAWHGALGDSLSRLALEQGLEASSILRLGKAQTPWQADPVIGTSFVLIPSISALMLERLGEVEQSRLAFGWSVSLAVGIHIFPSLVP
ncbi:MAG TPA: hypothetical protein VJT73_20790 [Polyangiaceae bacterium]|nr:hypothetical protein [Polyangiaceae bacterium]